MSKYDDNEVIAEAVWTIADIKIAIKYKFGKDHEVTDEEIDEVLDNFKAEDCEDHMIEEGWFDIKAAVEDTF